MCRRVVLIVRDKYHFASKPMRTTIFWTVMTLALGIPVCASVKGQQPSLLRSEFIYETAPFPSCHASTIAETKSGLIAAWFGGTHERHPDVGIWVSRLENGK